MRRACIPIWSYLLLSSILCSEAVGGPIAIGGFNADRVFRPFSDSSYSDMRSRLQDPYRFGVGTGIVQESIHFAAETLTVTPAYLSQVDVFVMTEVMGELSAAEVEALTDFVRYQRGSLIMISDTLHSPGTNLLGGFDGSLAANQILGVLDPGASVAMTDDDGSIGDPNDGLLGLSGEQSATAGYVEDQFISKILSGPFGKLDGDDTFGATWHNALYSGSESQIIGKRDGELPGLGILMEIRPGFLLPTSGGVMVAGDVLFNNLFIPPSGGSLENENNAIFLENFLAQHAHLSNITVIPEPSSVLLLLFGSACCLGWGYLRRARNTDPRRAR